MHCTRVRNAVTVTSTISTAQLQTFSLFRKVHTIYILNHHFFGCDLPLVQGQIPSDLVQLRKTTVRQTTS